MRGRSAILNLLTCLALAATGLVVLVVALVLVVPALVPRFTRAPTQLVQVSAFAPQPTATAGLSYPTLPPEWTATSSPQPSPSNAVSATPTPTASPAGTDTPAASATSTASATPAHVLTTSTVVNVRSGPGAAYPVVGRLSAGQTVPVIGRDSSAQWFAVNAAGAPQGIGWVWSTVVTYSGSINDLPVIQPSGPPPSTNTPAATAPPAATSAPTGQGANGIQTLQFQMEQTTGSANANMWFDFQVVNTTGTTINYGILAAHTDQGVTADSWHAPLLPGQLLTWRDHINFPSTGTYQVYLGICYASHDPCRNGGAGWTQLSNSVTVTIQ